MYCKSCGKTIDNDSKFCIYCGAKLFSDNIQLPENNEIIPIEIDSSKIKNENASTSKSTNLFYSKISTTSFNKQENVLEEFALPSENNKSSKKIIGIVLSVIGCFLLAWNVSFKVLSDELISQNFFAEIGGVSVSTKYHLFVYSFVFLFIASILISKDRLIFKKVISISIDALALFVFLYLIEYFFIGRDSSDGSYTSYFLYYNVFTSKIIAWSFFLLIYYLVGELFGGTIGKKIAGLISQNQEKGRISIKQSIQKTLIYSAPIWLLLISFLWNPQILNNLSESIILNFCQWGCFILLFTSLFMIFISKENNSLADMFSKSRVDKIHNKKPLLNIDSLQTTKINSPGISINCISDISELYKLIALEKKKIFPGKNQLIANMLKELFKDKNSFFVANSIYKDQYSKDIPEHLISISSAYGLIYYYVEPLVKLGVCEEDFPHKTTNLED